VLQRLAQLRKSNNWSLQETADQLGIAKSTYAGYESGYREPPLKALVQIAELFNTTVDYILNRVDYKSSVIELAELLNNKDNILTLDEAPLTSDELYDFIAFIRVKRALKRN
jgi:transcriptional regulator with XRE-family HTH domain